MKITPEGAVKVLDFGLAKLDAGDRPNAPLTHSPTMIAGETQGGVILGTAAYMSPEQARGLGIDKRTDIWAFGCVLFEMLTGRATFGRATLSDTIASILEHAPDWSALPDDTPAGVRRLLRRCLEKNAKRRMRDIGDALLELDQSRTGAGDVVRRRTIDAAKLFRMALRCGISRGPLAGSCRDTSVVEPGSAPPSFSQVIQLGEGASEIGPAISPDGKWIAYLSNVRGPTDVWVRFLSGGDPVNLTATTSLAIQTRADLGGLAISPDGSLIAFDAGATKDTPAQRFDSWVIPAPTGGAPRKLVELGRSVRWSPDGTQIAFIRAGSSAGDALFVARSDGGSPREVVPVRGGMHLHWPAWSHDGRYIYFTYSTSTANREPTSIYRVSVAGGPLEPW